MKQVWVLLLALFLVNCGGDYSSPTPTPQPTTPSVKLTSFVTGLSSPLDMQIADDNSGRLFVVEQGGRVRIISNGALIPGNFLDISSKVSPEGGELGLLGIAFHPDFAHDPRLYVNYTRTLATDSYESVIAEYQVSAGDPNQADPTERVLLTVMQPHARSNHKAGQLAFGTDRFLYFGLGDGGGGGDPDGNGQNPNTYLGKLLRIDVDGTGTSTPYAIPAGNMFPNGVGGLPEIYALGFRNPWRFSFDQPTGRLFMADVGQSNWEEIDLVDAPATQGGNFGWNVMEGSHCYPSGNTCDMTGKVLPIAEYDHSNENSAVIGGFVYHGTAVSGLSGMYVFGDLSGKIWGLKQNADDSWTRSDLTSGSFQLAAFGQDASGELYIVDFSGSISKIVNR
jgi:glucose/arabinose dehydrogenase